MDNSRDFGAAEKRQSSFRNLDSPKGAARFSLDLGYDHDNVARGLVKRFGLEPQEAGSIVADVALTIDGGGQ